MAPIVRYFILCDDVEADPINPLRITIRRLLNKLYSSAEPPFPFVCPQFRVLALFACCPSRGDLLLRIVREGGVHPVFQTAVRRMRFVGGPLVTAGARFTIENCRFPEAGLYWVECVFSGMVLARQALPLDSRGSTVDES